MVKVYYANELYHHGILGQKWGVRRYQNPDGSLTDAGRNRYLKNTKKRAEIQDAANSLQKEMDKWTYGVIQNGKTYSYDDDSIKDVNWNKYKTQTLKELSKTKTGTCWDFVNYEYDKLKKMGANPKAYMMVLQKSDKKDDIVTHTFVTYNDGTDEYWMESAWWPKRGNHKINSIDHVINEFTNTYGKNKSYTLWEYDPSGMDGLSNTDYFDGTQQKIVRNKTKKD